MSRPTIYRTIWQVAYYVLLVILFLALCSIGIIVKHVRDEDRLSRHAPTPVISRPVQVVSTPGQVPATGKLLTRLTGSQTVSQQFVAPTNWAVYYNFVCQNASGDSFAINVESPSDITSTTDQPVIDNGDESGYGSQVYHSGGVFHLSLNTSGDCSCR